MMDSEQDTFFPLLHAMIRAVPASEQETLRARAVMKWAGDHGPTILSCLDEDEIKVIGHAMEHWREHHEAPSRKTLEGLVRKDDLPEAQLGLLENYDVGVPFLTKITGTTIEAADMGALLNGRMESWTRQKARFMLRQAKIILETGQASGNYRDPMRKGFKDMRDFLLQELLLGTFAAKGTAGGAMKELAPQVASIYRDNEQAKQSGRHKIFTGIPVIDNEIGGFDRKTVNLLLGRTGHRKSAVARTIAYYAALNGFRTLFIPLEWPYEEEIAIFAMMHAHNLRFEGSEAFSIKRYRDAELNAEEKELLETELVPSLIGQLGTDLVIRSMGFNSWPNIRAMIEAENADQPLDLVVIDHVMLYELGKGIDKTFEMHQIVREMKQMSMHFNDGQGLVFVSPVHGNRKGYETAKATGVWEATDIYLYSEMEKSADTIVSCYMDDDLKTTNKMKMGFSKSRRSGAVEPRLIEVDSKCGLVGGSPVTRMRRAKEESEKQEDLLAVIDGRPVKARVGPQGGAVWPQDADFESTGPIAGKRKRKPIGPTTEDMQRLVGANTLAGAR
jgi:hypothetical protein